nr:zinc ribbon domain-containing protein [Paraburkholderia sp. BL6669N2]
MARRAVILSGNYRSITPCGNVLTNPNLRRGIRIRQDQRRLCALRAVASGCTAAPTSIAKKWQVLIVEHHAGYISWDEYEEQSQIDHRQRQHEGQHGSGVRSNAAVLLLAGLIRCGHCGRKLHVAYSGTKGDHRPAISCQGSMINHGGPPLHLVRCGARRPTRR